MNTPNKNPIQNSLSELQESPFSKYANTSLSPLPIVKKIPTIYDTLNSSLASPPSVFALPRFSRKTTLLRRHQNPAVAKPVSGIIDGNTNSTATENINDGHQSDRSVRVQPRGEGSSDDQNCAKPLEKSSEYAKLNPRVLNNENEKGSLSCDGVSYNGLLIIDSLDNVTTKGSLQVSQEAYEFSSCCLDVPFDQGQAYDMQNPFNVNDMNQTDEKSTNLDYFSVNELLSYDSNDQITGNELYNNIYGGMQRRCLTFEMARTKKSTESVVLSTRLSSTMQDPLINSSGLFSSNEEFNSDNPKKKRKKIETIGEGIGCNRCKCKKSKCLKLYCDCFAAGVYCAEPCSCVDCFNNPIYEDTVYATRKQIESRNPQAFTPKVIKTTNSSLQVGPEDSTQTPASARHKRGCNCRKSNCLKKYCECYQAGVGCSANCRCEGCKNAFGRKDVEIEKLQASHESLTDMSSNIHGFHDDDGENFVFAMPMTPSRLHRQSIPQATSSKGKPPRSSCLRTMSSSYGIHPIDGVERSSVGSQSKIMKKNQNVSDEIPKILQNNNSIIKKSTSSPNSKRISSSNYENIHRQSVESHSSRKHILQSIPSFPSLSPPR
ncbi:unnamed protein product [Amaranthus hypochondriacus]